MFKARLHFNHTIVRNIYAVQQNEFGLTQFLVFDEYSRKWLWMPASEYEPIEDAHEN